MTTLGKLIAISMNWVTLRVTVVPLAIGQIEQVRSYVGWTWSVRFHGLRIPAWSSGALTATTFIVAWLPVSMGYQPSRVLLLGLPLISLAHSVFMIWASPRFAEATVELGPYVSVACFLATFLLFFSHMKWTSADRASFRASPIEAAPDDGENRDL